MLTEGQLHPPGQKPEPAADWFPQWDAEMERVASYLSCFIVILMIETLNVKFLADWMDITR